jgi:hypothetical protein
MEMTTLEYQGMIESNISKFVKSFDKDAMYTPKVRTVSLDWLELRFIQPGHMEGDEFIPTLKLSNEDSNDVGPYTFVPTGHKTRVWGMIHEVFDGDGEKIGVFCSMPHCAKIFPANHCTFKMENALLYTEWLDILRAFAGAYDLQLHAVKQIDIALDGTGFMSPVSAMLTQDVEKVGRAMFTPTMNNKGHKILHFNLGSKKSERFMRCYWKEREIEHSKKYYIRDFWKENGVDESQFDSMERLEVSLSGHAMVSLWGNVTWSKIELLTDALFLQSVFETTRKGLYDFRENTDEKTNVTRVKKAVSILYTGTTKKLQRFKVVTSKHIRQIQTTIKTTYNLALATGKEYYKLICDEIVNNTGMQSWFDKRHNLWKYEFHLSKKKGRDFMSILHNYTPNEQLCLYEV